jgi:protein-disulfide isomerase
MRRLAALVVIAASGACGPPSAPAEPRPANTGGDSADAVARLDAAVERALAGLDRAEDALVPGPRLDAATRVRVPLRRDPAAPPPWVSVTYFHELACKHCANLRGIARDLAGRYDAARVVVVPRVIAVHRVAAVAARLVECAGERRGHPLSDALWTGAYDRKDFSFPNLVEIARAGGLPAGELVAELADGACQDQIIGDHALALRAGVIGTPTLFVNGKPIEGLLDPQVLYDAIAAELAAIEAHLARGGTVADYHATWQATARAP